MTHVLETLIVLVYAGSLLLAFAHGRASTRSAEEETEDFARFVATLKRWSEDPPYDWQRRGGL